MRDGVEQVQASGSIACLNVLDIVLTAPVLGIGMPAAPLQAAAVLRQLVHLVHDKQADLRGI
jgi:hypothetical protein